MAFNVDFYVFQKNENSTKRPGAPDVSFPCELIAETSIINPRIILNVAGNPTSYNYAFINEFNGRYYFVNNWSWYNGRWSATLVEDVLATWKISIGNSTEYILRSSTDWNGTITDTTYPATSNFKVQSQIIDTPWNLGYTKGSYIVGLIGSSGLTEYWQMPALKFTNFVRTIFSEDFYSKMTLDLKDIGYGLGRAMLNPMQYLSSVTWFPMEFGAGPAKSIELGWWDTGFDARPVSDTYGFTKTFVLPRHPQAASRGSYLNTSPYTTYTLDVRPWGTIDIDATKVTNVNSVDIQVSVDPFSGIGFLSVYAGAERIAFSVAQVGCKVQVSQMIVDALSAGQALLNSVAPSVTAGLAGLAMGPVGMYAGIATGMTNGIVNAIDYLKPQATTNGIDGGRGALEGNWQLIARFATIVDEDLNHRGRPLCELRRINTLPGYLMVSDAKIDFSATKEEIMSIKQYLEGGFFYE